MKCSGGYLEIAPGPLAEAYQPNMTVTVDSYEPAGSEVLFLIQAIDLCETQKNAASICQPHFLLGVMLKPPTER
jgi:hypothetical protein